MAKLESNPTLKPILKWPGGKSDELGAIALAGPDLTGRYIDPFVGGGSVLLAVATHVDAWANDICPELIALYRGGACADSELRKALNGISIAWEELSAIPSVYEDLATSLLSPTPHGVRQAIAKHVDDLVAIAASAGDLASTLAARIVEDFERKAIRIVQTEARVGRRLSYTDMLANVESAVRSSFYYSIRDRYNASRRTATFDQVRTADFLYLREFSYAAMFRFNHRGDFNVPYGGVTYNRKRFGSKVESLFHPEMQARLSNTTWRLGDFAAFLGECSPEPQDFAFIDPPYDSEFSTYDNRPFDRPDQERLAKILSELRCHVMIVIKDTPFVRRLYSGTRWSLDQSPKTYMWTIKSRNDRSAHHLLIRNFEPTLQAAA